MPQEHMRSIVAGGTIRRSRVVYVSTDYTAVEQVSYSVSFMPLGISQEWCRNPPGTPYDTSLNAAVSGEELLVYTDGSIALAECGNTVTAGKMVVSDTTSRIVDAPGAPPFSFYTVGRALESGAAGDVVRIEVILR